jgi:outer membrane protein assembly factor BamA
MADLFKKLMHHWQDSAMHSPTKPRLHLSCIPAAGYTLGTGFAGVVSANAAFYTRDGANISSILTSITYTQYNQIILPAQTSIWTNDNKFNIILDWRFLKYPSETFGLGDYTSLNDGYNIDYSTVHFHQTVMRKMYHDIYAGIGFNIDYYWNIKELDPPGNKITDFENYGFTEKEFASGITLNFLYDTRKNSINPTDGNFFNIIYHPIIDFGIYKVTWRSLIMDVRKYVTFPKNSKNLLAFWTYDWFTLNGKPPYLMLPYTGGDPYVNTGRGYVQGRYRGNNMVYLETEYRFNITPNGLLGGVLFANAESFSYPPSNNFELVLPACGLGVRLKLNKYSRTNVALDYGFGTGGSRGFFVNLGEVF